MKTIYQKYCDGDKLTDKELLQGIKDFQTGYAALSELGPEFRISTKECVRVAIALEGFAEARGIK